MGVTAETDRDIVMHLSIVRGGEAPYGALRWLFNALAGAALLAGLSMSAAVSHAAAEPLRLLALGDSLTAGYGLREEDGFTTQLERALRARGYDVEVINAGVSGDTTAGGLARLDWALADRPDAVLVELGANDMLRGVDPESARANLDAILAKLKERGVPTLLAGMYASPSLGQAYARRFDAIFPELAQTYAVSLYPFFLEGVATDPALNQGDGIHPNAAGVKVIVEGIAPHVARLLDAVRQPTGG